MSTFSPAFPNIDFKSGTEVKTPTMFPDDILKETKSSSAHATSLINTNKNSCSDGIVRNLETVNDDSNDNDQDFKQLSFQNYSKNESIKNKVKAGKSKRSEFPLHNIPSSKIALLVIDIQEHLSQKPLLGDQDEDSNSDAYLFDVSLPSVIPRIESLISVCK